MTLLSSFAEAKVLLVDDNQANIHLLEAMLAKAGMRHVFSTTESHRALRLVDEIEPDVVLLDLHMPVPDGFQLLAALSARRPHIHLPVLVLTADTNRDAAHRALTLGARDFLTKPLDLTEVMLRVRNQLEARELHRALQQHNAGLREQLEEREQQDRLAQDELRRKREAVERVLASGGPDMAFQPIARLPGRAVLGVEALARFPAEPARGPDRWFADAAEVGLGADLEIAAVRSALRQLPRIPPQAYLAVNVSPQTILSGRLDEVCDPSSCGRLVFELTEHVAVEDYGPVRDAIRELRDHGARLAVDDTGAGFASLRHILSLAPEIIKIDISLTRGIDVDPVRRALASSLVAFAAEIGAELVAEGVETADELIALERLNVGAVQGYHIGRPAPIG